MSPASHALHADTVRVLTGWQPGDAAQERLRRVFLTHLNTRADGMWRECVAGHITASTALLNASGSRVLLTLHHKVKRWLQLGGHCERTDATLRDAALREATEESGIDGLRLLGGPARLDRHVVRCHPEGSFHLDVQYVAIAPPTARYTISAESDDLCWFPMDALPDDTDDALHQLVLHAADLVRRPVDREMDGG